MWGVFSALVIWAYGFSLNDQFGEKIDFNGDSVQQVLFAGDMDSYKLLKKTLNDFARPKELLQKNHMAVVADISGMPSLISKFVALPKMKELPYPIYLDEKGEQTKPWPHEKGKLLLLKKQSQQWVAEKAFATSEELAAFMRTLESPAPEGSR